MSSENFKEPYNLGYFLAFLAVLALPTLVATLTWIRVLGGWDWQT
ncbi:hypothetical protein [Neiella holothuriorum]|nr:hypothetical protein [Neiella holothuriorum]